jgi:hypothetical protein
LTIVAIRSRQPFCVYPADPVMEFSPWQAPQVAVTASLPAPSGRSAWAPLAAASALRVQ